MRNQNNNDLVAIRLGALDDAVFLLEAATKKERSAGGVLAGSGYVEAVYQLLADPRLIDEAPDGTIAWRDGTAHASCAEPLAATEADQALADILEVCDCCKGGCAARERIEALRGRLTVPTTLDTAEADRIIDSAIRQLESWSERHTIVEQLRSLRSRLVPPPQPATTMSQDVAVRLLRLAEYPSFVRPENIVHHATKLRDAVFAVCRPDTPRSRWFACLPKGTKTWRFTLCGHLEDKIGTVLGPFNSPDEAFAAADKHAPCDPRPELDPEKLTDEQCRAIFEKFKTLWPCDGEADSGRKYARAVASVCRLPAPLPKADARPELDPEKLTKEQCAAITAAYDKAVVEDEARGMQDKYSPRNIGRRFARGVAAVCRVPAPLPEPEDVPISVCETARVAWRDSHGDGSSSMRDAYRVFRDWLMQGGAK